MTDSSSALRGLIADFAAWADLALSHSGAHYLNGDMDRHGQTVPFHKKKRDGWDDLAALKRRARRALPPKSRAAP